jgi:porin
MRSAFLALVSWPLSAAPQSPKRRRRPTTTSRRIPTRAESTIQEKTPGLLPNPLQKYGIKLVCRDVYRGDFGQRFGRHQAVAVYEGRLSLAVDVDLQKLVGAEQLTCHANVFQIHGGGLSRDALQNIFVVSGIEALPTTGCTKRSLRSSGEQNWFRSSWANSPPTANSSIRNTRTSSRTRRWDGLPSLRSTFPVAAMGARVLVNVTEQLSVLGGHLRR